MSSSSLSLLLSFILQKRLHVCQAECLAPGAYGKIFWKQPFRGNRRDCFAIRDSIKFSRPFPFAINHEHFSSQLFIRYPSSILHIELGRISSHRYGGLKISCVGWSSGDVGGMDHQRPILKLSSCLPNVPSNGRDETQELARIQLARSA